MGKKIIFFITLFFITMHFQTASCYAENIDKWVGSWERDENASFSIDKNSDNSLTIHGDAVWYNPDLQMTHMGGINASGIPQNGYVKFTDKIMDCVLNLQMKGNIIIAKDNNLCGGANVTFTGQYHKTNQKLNIPPASSETP